MMMMMQRVVTADQTKRDELCQERGLYSEHVLLVDQGDMKQGRKRSSLNSKRMSILLPVLFSLTNKLGSKKFYFPKFKMRVKHEKQFTSILWLLDYA